MGWAALCSGGQRFEAMLTIFSVPKPFLGHIGIIQRNAIRSWTRLHSGHEIVLCGDETGVAEAATEFGATHMASVECNEYGTPLLNSVFAQVQLLARHRLLCYVNADIILLSDFVEAVERIRLRRFLVVGQRWDVDLTAPWDFKQSDWQQQLRRYIAEHGVLHPPAGSDYFVFLRHHAIGELPPFAVGRPGWDNWFIYKARKLRIPVVDVTKVVTVIHQNHGYSHVPDQRGKVWVGPEADRNRELMGGRDYVFTPLDATHVMTSGTLLPALGYKYLQRRWQTLPILIPGTKQLVRLLNMMLTPFRVLYRLVGSR